MTITAAIRRVVRGRASFACEYCGVSEVDTGGELTVDHYRPRAAGGHDDLENLLYCCTRCNQYKADYWPADSDAPTLWNPRHGPISTHFIELADASLYPLSTAGAFTLNRLRLNRPPLVAYRRRKRDEAELRRLVTRYRELASVLEQLYLHQVALLQEQQTLLHEQQSLLSLLASQESRAEEQSDGGDAGSRSRRAR